MPEDSAAKHILLFNAADGVAAARLPAKDLQVPLNQYSPSTGLWERTSNRSRPHDVLASKGRRYNGEPLGQRG